MTELTYHDLKEERDLAEHLIKEDKSYLIKEIIENYRRLDELEREVNELIDFEKWYYILEDRIIKSVEFLENDLQGFLYSCEYNTLLKILKGEENNGKN